VIRHNEAAHQHYRACYQPFPLTRKSEISTQTHLLHPPPRRHPPPENLPTRFIRHVEASPVLRQNLQRFRIRHIFRRVDFEVEFESRRSLVRCSALSPTELSQDVKVHSLGLDPQPLQHPGYRVARVIPRSADGWVYGYVRRAKMWLMFYSDNRECSGNCCYPDGGCGSRWLWRRLIDVKGLMQYDWGESEEQGVEVRKEV
jgi:hypothetical protein